MQAIGHTSTYFIRTKNIEFNKMIWIVLIVIFLIPIIILLGFWISHDGLFCQSVVNINGTAMYNLLNSSCSQAGKRQVKQFRVTVIGSNPLDLDNPTNLALIFSLVSIGSSVYGNLDWLISKSFIYTIFVKCRIMFSNSGISNLSQSKTSRRSNSSRAKPLLFHARAYIGFISKALL